MTRFTTPMMKQYLKIKRQYPDCLLFFRLGDFYELFLDDAKIGAKILNITLTSRDKGRDGRIPMAGVPYHAVDSYLGKLVKAGYKVAICEQTSQPDGKGIVDREVVRIITPGTILDEKILDQNQNNYITTFSLDKNLLAIAAADISTGQFQTGEIKTETPLQTLTDELTRLNPAECILSEELYNRPSILKTIKTIESINIFPFNQWQLFADNAQDVLKKHFQVKTLKGFGLADKPLALKTTAALLGYLKQTQKDRIQQIKTIRLLKPENHLVLDRSTILNLEIFTTLHRQEKKGSLIYHIDKTLSPMGGRLLRQWLLKPLISKTEITQRLTAVEELFTNNQLREKLREQLKEISDIERILARLNSGLGNGRDLIRLKHSLNQVFKIKKTIKEARSPLINQIFNHISPQIRSGIKKIEKFIVEEPPVELKQGGIIKPGTWPELDQLRQTIGGAKEWIIRLEIEERKRTGINSLKIRFNKVFGYYIEVSKPNIHLVPDDYIRKQTLVNAERFITPQLKKQEQLILTAEERINQLEYQLFLEVVKEITRLTWPIQKAAQAIAVLDCLSSLAHLAKKNDYIKPEINTKGLIKIKDGRHPVVEKLLEDTLFVPNNTLLNQTDHQLIILTGPNMAGKSVYIRQVALIILLAQIGSFVPAKKASISLVDRIFVRSGASDAISSGLSTFMLEMVETSYILRNATENSLIILDEIGRGTSTYDGISIAWATAEYLATNKDCLAKTLFATHYHELQQLAKEYPNIKNFQMAVEEENGEPIFLHQVVPGKSSHSYGIAVAQQAGLPKEIISRAKEVLKTLESRRTKTRPTKLSSNYLQQIPIFIDKTHPVLERLKKLDLNNLTPLEAFEELVELKKEI